MNKKTNVLIWQVSIVERITRGGLASFWCLCCVEISVLLLSSSSIGAVSLCLGPTGQFRFSSAILTSRPLKEVWAICLKSGEKLGHPAGAQSKVPLNASSRSYSRYVPAGGQRTCWRDCVRAGRALQRASQGCCNDAHRCFSPFHLDSAEQSCSLQHSDEESSGTEPLETCPEGINHSI